MRKFEYWRPGSLDEARKILANYQGRGIILAAGTDIIPKIKQGALKPDALISINGIESLRSIQRVSNGSLWIGATARLIDLARADLLKPCFPVICRTAALMGSPQVRSRATAGGNICNAAPSADLSTCLLALGAKAVFEGRRGKQKVALEGFFKGPGETILQHGEILSGITVPDPGPDHFATYLKLGARAALNLAIVGVGLFAQPKTGGGFSPLRLTLGAVAPTPIRARRAEECVMSEGLADKTISEAGRLAAEDSAPIDDQRSSREYRLAMVRTLVTKALTELRRKYEA